MKATSSIISTIFWPFGEGLPRRSRILAAANLALVIFIIGCAVSMFIQSTTTVSAQLLTPESAQ